MFLFNIKKLYNYNNIFIDRDLRSGAGSAFTKFWGSGFHNTKNYFGIIYFYVLK